MQERFRRLRIEGLMKITIDQIKMEDLLEILKYLLEKTQTNDDLTKNELKYFYDLCSIMDNDYIEEIRKLRDPEKDMLVMFECVPNQIVHNHQEFQQAVDRGIEIKAYVGELFPDFFQLIPDSVEHIYIEFPERPVRIKKIKLGTKSKEELILSLGASLNVGAKLMINKPELYISLHESEETLVIVQLRDLSPLSLSSIEQVATIARGYGLDICPPDVGPQLRLQYSEQMEGEDCLICMDPIKVNGDMQVFRLRKLAGASQWVFLGTENAVGLGAFSPHTVFVFSLNKHF
jgi:hypothetical protein